MWGEKKGGARSRKRSSHTTDGLAALLKQQKHKTSSSLPNSSFTSDDESMTVILRNFMNKYLPVHTESRGGGVLLLPPSPHPHRTVSEMVLWTVCCSCYFSLWRLFLALQHGKHRDAQRKESDGCEGHGERERGTQNSPGWQCVRSGAPRGPLDASGWMGALVRWPGSLRTGYERTGMLLRCVWPPDLLSNVCFGSFETQHIYLWGSEERRRSGCQNKVIVPLTASSAVEEQLWQAHNVAASASPGRRAVISGHAGNPVSCSPLSSPTPRAILLPPPPFSPPPQTWMTSG